MRGRNQPPEAAHSVFTESRQPPAWPRLLNSESSILRSCLSTPRNTTSEEQALESAMRAHKEQDFSGCFLTRSRCTLNIGSWHFQLAPCAGLCWGQSLSGAGAIAVGWEHWGCWDLPPWAPWSSLAAGLAGSRGG